MAIAITFLKKFHPSKDERNRWLDKFIEEPTADYKKRIVDGMYEVDATF